MNTPSVGGLVHQVSPALGCHLRGRVLKQTHLGWDPLPYLRGFNSSADAPAHTTTTLLPRWQCSSTPELERLSWNETLPPKDWLAMEHTLFQQGRLSSFDREDYEMGIVHEDSAEPTPKIHKSSTAEASDSALAYTQGPGRPAHRYRQPASISRFCQINRTEVDRVSGESLRGSCRCMHKSHPSLQGPLPPHDETLAYLQQLFRVPGVDSDISLSSRFWGDGGNRGHPQWLPVCLLAIWVSPAKSLTTEGIHRALIAAVPYCQANADEAKRQKGKQKRTGWPASVAAVLSKERIFTQRTNDGRKSKDWRIDIRGAGFHAHQSKCSHNQVPRA